MPNPVNLTVVLTLRQAEAILAICEEAQASGYHEGELLRDTRQIHSADTAIKRLRDTVEMGLRREKAIRDGK